MAFTPEKQANFSTHLLNLIPMAEPGTKELTLPSTFEAIEQLESFVKELQQWAQFNDDNFGRIMLTLSEAVTNAVVHGNKENPEKKVFIKAILKDRTLQISVKDQGEGFDPGDLSDPLKEENLLKEGGRGVYLIKQYADDMQFFENGTKIIMTFRLAPVT